MSTAVSTHSLPGPFESEAEEVTCVLHSYGETFAKPDTIPYKSATPARPEREQDTKLRVIRRLQGFLIEFQDTDAKVAFVQDGQTILYFLPSKSLRQSGIIAQNQPFEMDEVEMESPCGPIFGYRFRPLAKPSDGFVETVELDPERQRKRDLIFKRFGKTQN